MVLLMHDKATLVLCCLVIISSWDLVSNLCTQHVLNMLLTLTRWTSAVARRFSQSVVKNILRRLQLCRPIPSNKTLYTITSLRSKSILPLVSVVQLARSLTPSCRVSATPVLTSNGNVHRTTECPWINATSRPDAVQNTIQSSPWPVLKLTA
jgi:hypothetical protein